MNEQTRTRIIAFVLIISVIWAGSDYFSDKKPSAEFEKPQTIKKLNAENFKSTSPLPSTAILSTTQSDWGRNPFFSKHFGVSDFTPEQPNEEIVWVLSGIIYNAGTPTAIINKRPVKVGQKINNAEVVKIKKEEVTIKIDDQELKLTISKG